VSLKEPAEKNFRILTALPFDAVAVLYLMKSVAHVLNAVVAKIVLFVGYLYYRFGKCRMDFDFVLVKNRVAAYPR
jgi:hypothetical protein